MLDDEFKQGRARLVRDLAEKADPFIKRRLLELAGRYEGDSPPRRTTAPNDVQFVGRSDPGSE